MRTGAKRRAKTCCVGTDTYYQNIEALCVYYFLPKKQNKTKNKTCFVPRHITECVLIDITPLLSGAFTGFQETGEAIGTDCSGIT